MNEPTCISIVIPAYQAAKYLAVCLESVLSQTYQNFEVLLVDDGATDETPSICDSYHEKDSRIQVIHQENSGLSSARNAGTAIASGDYVLFLDADDFWDDAEALSRLVARTERTHADVVNFSYKKYYEDTSETVPYFNNLPEMPATFWEKRAQVNYLTENGLYIASACNKLIRRELLKAPEMRFDPGVFSEDIVWCLKLLMKAESFDFVCENFYCYRQRKGSITHTVDDKKCRDLCENIIQCAELLKSANAEIRSAAERYTAYQLGTFIKNQALAEHPQKECVQKLKAYRILLKNHGNSHKLRILDISCRLFGFSGTCHLTRFLYARQRAGGRA